MTQTLLSQSVSTNQTPSQAQTLRDNMLMTWLDSVFDGAEFTIQSLAGDASTRRYHRLVTDDQQRYIVMDSSEDKEAMAQFINVANLLSTAVHVPEMIAFDLAQGFLVLEDFGAVEFAHLLVDADKDAIDGYYQWAMDALIDLQGISVALAQDDHKIPLYDRELLNREMDLFSDWFLPYIGAPVDQKAWEGLKSWLIERILAQPQVIVHRDYHSRNLMQNQNDAKILGVIDFQDAVIGAYTYDLVSLVRDAYIDFPEAWVDQWIADFWQKLNASKMTCAQMLADFETEVNIMGVQRHLKVLGIFVRLAKRDGKNRYLADIPKVMRDLVIEINALMTNETQAIAPFYEWLNSSILPAFEQTFNVAIKKESSSCRSPKR